MIRAGRVRELMRISPPWGYLNKLSLLALKAKMFIANDVLCIVDSGTTFLHKNMLQAKFLTVIALPVTVLQYLFTSRWHGRIQPVGLEGGGNWRGP